MCLSVNVMCIPQISVNIHRPLYNFFFFFCLLSLVVLPVLFTQRYKANLTFRRLSLSNPVETFRICLIFQYTLWFTFSFLDVYQHKPKNVTVNSQQKAA